MATLTYPGVSITEIDRSTASTRSNTGVPAGIIGTADSGPAYVPLTFSTYQNMTNVFGLSGGRFGPVAVNLWLSNGANANATYLRVLGAGDGTKRSTSTGAVNRAGFVVGEQQVGASGIVGANPYANSNGILGMTYFLGCYMSESAGSTYFSSAGIQDSPKAMPIIRGILMTPSGVSLSLSGNYTTTALNQPAGIATANSGISGSYDFTTSTFVMLLNGHINNPSEQSLNVITASFNPASPSYLPNVLNTNPFDYQKKGHYLYTWYDVSEQVAAVTGTNILAAPYTQGDTNKQDVVFITSSSLGRNTSNASTPNFEQFSERYTHPKSPFVISQNYGGPKYDLFRIHALADGVSLGDDYQLNTLKNYKITIGNIIPGANANSYSQFDLEVRPFDLADGAANPLPGSYFAGLTLDPNSDNYIASRIGDQNIYFDFDRANGSQKIAIVGDYPVTNNYIRVELSADQIAGNVPTDAVPAGYRGYGYLFTSGSSLATFSAVDLNFAANQYEVLRRAVIPPVPTRQSISDGIAPSAVLNTDYTWGSKFESITSLSEQNAETTFNKSVLNFAKFFPSYDVTGKKFFIENTAAADTFENNIFTIENIQVVTGAFGVSSAILWESASYIRNGNITANDANKSRALAVNDLNDLYSSNRQNVYYTFFLQGGFDGVNIFDTQKANLTDLAATREIDDATNQGGVNGPTVSSFKKAIDIMGSSADVDIQLLAVPGIRTPAITNYAVTAVENRFDALYLMDIQQKDMLNTYVTSSNQIVSISNTVTDFRSRGLNTSFAAAYFPDVSISSPDGTGTITIPPSAVVLAAYAKNDTYAPWYAPAGTTRGGVPALTAGFTALDVPLNESSPQLGTIYGADINPIVKLSSGTQTVVWGQKTLLKNASSLDRVNVRRLLIDLRRKVRSVANSLLFEPNTQATLTRFNNLVNPILQDAQTRFGVSRYKVIIDTSTTTQADIDNNTIRGKIFLQPVRVAEFISLDFVINASSAT